MENQTIVLSDNERRVKLSIDNTFNQSHRSEHKRINVRHLLDGDGKHIIIELKNDEADDAILPNPENKNAVDLSYTKERNQSQLIELSEFLINTTHPFSEYIQSYYIDILLNLLPDNDSALNQSINKDKVNTFRLLAKYINKNIKTDLTIQALINISNMSERSLYYLFQESVSMTPLVYIRKRKIEQIYLELKVRKGSPSISKLAMDFGFYNLGRFSQLYRQQIGELPSETRAKKFR